MTMERSRRWRLHLLRILLCRTIVFLVLTLPSAAQTNYFTFSENNTDGSTTICTGRAAKTKTTYGALCLTPAGDEMALNIAGRCFYKDPIQFSPNATARSFSTMFKYNTVRFPTAGPGQGFTIFIGPDNTSEGDAEYYLGWLNNKTNNDVNGHNFAVEFDIFQNLEANDTDDNHVGINVNSLDSKIKVPGRLAVPDDEDFHLATYQSNEMFYAWIDYDGVHKMIEVRLSRSPGKPCNSFIRERLDLTDILLENMYVGFSSSTGDMTNSQTTIFDWNFNTTDKAQNVEGAPDKTCKDSAEKWTWVKTLAVLVAVLSTIVFTMLFILLYLHRRTLKMKRLEVELLSELQHLDYGAHEYTYRDLSLATKGFSAKEVLGKGGFGVVYKGTLSRNSSGIRSKVIAEESSTVVAVKKVSKKSSQGVKEFMAEVKIIGRLRHINLVRLLGWCHERGELLLVYEFMPNGNLHDLVFPKDAGQSCGEPALLWEMRMRSLRGVAAALVFLHEECEQRIVHRDVKSCNVMLDKDFNARLGDFGLARLYDRNEAHYTTAVAGTIGYMAPECVVTGQATSQSDVYSFGAMMLEVATGRKPSDIKRTPGNEGLVSWVWRLQEEGRVLEAVDVNLGGNYNVEEMKRVLKLGLFCCLPDSRARPTMRQVQAVLQEGEFQVLSSQLPSRPTSGLSQDFVHSDSETMTNLMGSSNNDLGTGSNFTGVTSITDWGTRTATSDCGIHASFLRSSRSRKKVHFDSERWGSV